MVMTVETAGGDAHDYCLGELRREDRDRYLTLLFAPRAHRPLQAALYAFNLECARAVTAGGEQALLGQMRLQWWRDSLARGLAGQADGPAHPVLAALTGQPHLIAPMQGLLSARERDLTDSPFATLADVVAHAAATGGDLAALASGQPEAGQIAAARAAGTAYALAGMLRAIPYQRPGRAYQGRLCLPQDILAGNGITAEEVWSGRRPELVAACARQVAGAARLELAKLNKARLQGQAISPLLQGSLARAYLYRLAKAGHDPFSPNLGLQPLARPLLLCWRAFLRRP